jgi:hypothetical protein
LSALLWLDYEQAKAFSNLRRTIREIHQAIGEKMSMEQAMEVVYVFLRFSFSWTCVNMTIFYGCRVGSACQKALRNA